MYEENLDRGIFATDPAFKAYARIGRGKDLRPRAFVDGYEEIAGAITPELQAVWLNQKSPKDGLAPPSAPATPPWPACGAGSGRAASTGRPLISTMWSL